MKFILTLLSALSPVLLLLFTVTSFASNQSIQSFNQAKKILEREVYPDNRKTLYCDASFSADKKVALPSGFSATKHKKRAARIEWEHIVPAENFGRAFKEWRVGDNQCVTSKGKTYKGRRCAEKINEQYRYLQADMFNLYPAIGAVNALRSNYNFTMLPTTPSSFGSCQMKIEQRKAEPPVIARGAISRTYLYMDATYEAFNMSKQQRQLMIAWDKMYPVEQWECTRTKKIAQLQKNNNDVVKSRCLAKGIW
ncbi:endonuclease [Colwellia sp. D2M02]|uniref:Deoxyribonuclease I n=1 Tax=Colwellia asteriadis TaxID=517723 RepID=A0ABN1L3S8_9GAMM|nr:endonuclease [Colwellia sp. D2M02]MBU2891819.1 endonuclease [Colwellia sp. D2M02]